jgi:hypothetical protein
VQEQDEANAEGWLAEKSSLEQFRCPLRALQLLRAFGPLVAAPYHPPPLPLGQDGCLHARGGSPDAEDRGSGVDGYHGKPQSGAPQREGPQADAGSSSGRQISLGQPEGRAASGPGANLLSEATTAPLLPSAEASPPALLPALRPLLACLVCCSRGLPAAPAGRAKAPCQPGGPGVISSAQPAAAASVQVPPLALGSGPEGGGSEDRGSEAVADGAEVGVRGARIAAALQTARETARRRTPAKAGALATGAADVASARAAEAVAKLGALAAGFSRGSK